jgi:1,4-dihydroxy-2-naphthoate octaprenyltransferase
LTSTHPQNISSFNAWILAIRPRTLPAAVAPVVVGSALAFAHRGFAFLPAAAALMVALFLQIAVNLANDYFDFMKGIDTDDRLGPIRVTQSGLIPSGYVKFGIRWLAGAADRHSVWSGGTRLQRGSISPGFLWAR